MSDDSSQSELSGTLTAHRGWLRSVISARLGDNEGTEDVLQEVNLAEMNEGKCAMTYDWGDSFTEHAKAPPVSLISG